MMMNVFNKIAWQNLKRHRARTMITIAGVILSTVLITGILCFVTSLQSYMVSGALDKYGHWEVGFTNVDNEILQSQKQEPCVKNIASFANLGYARLENSQNPDKPYVFLAGFNEETTDVLPITLISGRMPETTQEIIVPAHLSSNGGVHLSLGDTVTFNLGQRVTKDGEALGQDTPYQYDEEQLVNTESKAFTIVGFYQRPSFEITEAPGYTIITSENDSITANSVSAFVDLKDPAQARDYAEDFTESMIYNDNVLRFLGLSDDSLFNTLLFTVGGILIVFIMIGSIFLIYNAFNISLGERMQQLGILLSVGATPKQLRYSVLFEGFCIGLMGIPIGILIGVPAIALILHLVSENFNNVLYDNVPLTLNISPLALGLGILLSMATILISASIPARKALKTPILECIRRNGSFLDDITPKRISSKLNKILSFEATLALKNFKRNKRRYRSIVASLVLSILLFVSANAFSLDLQHTAEGAAAVTNYDIGLTVDHMEEKDLFSLYTSLQSLPSVTDSNLQSIYRKSCKIEAAAFSDELRQGLSLPATVASTDLTILFEVLDDESFEAFRSNLGVEEDALIGIAALLDDDTSDMFTQDTISFVMNQESQKVELIDSMLPDIPPSSTYKAGEQPYMFEVLVPWSLKDSLFENETPLIVGVTFQSEHPQQTLEDIQEILDQYGSTLNYSLTNVHAMLEENRNLLFIIRLFSGVFIGMITLIAIANVFNTIATNIRLRRRELAMLRSVGMGEGSFDRMMRIECAIYGGWTLILGLPLAILSSFLIHIGMTEGGAENLSYQPPWLSLLLSVLGVLLIIFLTMLYATRKIKKENIIDALRDEMA